MKWPIEFKNSLYFFWAGLTDDTNMQLGYIFINTIRPKLKNSNFSGAWFFCLLICKSFMED